MLIPPTVTADEVRNQGLLLLLLLLFRLFLSSSSNCSFPSPLIILFFVVQPKSPPLLLWSNQNPLHFTPLVDQPEFTQSSHGPIKTHNTLRFCCGPIKTHCTRLVDQSKPTHSSRGPIKIHCIPRVVQPNSIPFLWWSNENPLYSRGPTKMPSTSLIPLEFTQEI